MDIRVLYQVLVMGYLAFRIQTASLIFDDDDDDPSWNRCPSIRNKLKNGRVKIRSRGRIAKFLCDPGYELVGKRFATCVRGQWNNPVPFCVARGCHKMPDIANGRVTEMYRGAYLLYDCLPGYRLQGVGSIYCDGRRWSSQQPACVVATSDPKRSCDFEDPDLCGWTHDPTHDFDWKRNQFSTPSGHVGTGPSYDHTFGKGKGGFYLYEEASSPRKVNDTSRLFSPVYPSSFSGGCFVFWYHMYGATIGGLRVYVKPESHVFVELSPTWEKYGDQGNQWLRGNVSVPSLSESFQIVIEGIRGTSYVGDTAIDDVNLTSSDCESIENVTENVAESLSDSCRGRCREPDDAASCGCNENCIENFTCCSDYRTLCAGGNETSENENPEEYLTPIPNDLGTTAMLSTMGGQDTASTVNAATSTYVSGTPEPTTISRSLTSLPSTIIPLSANPVWATTKPVSSTTEIKVTVPISSTATKLSTILASSATARTATEPVSSFTPSVTTIQTVSSTTRVDAVPVSSSTLRATTVRASSSTSEVLITPASSTSKRVDITNSPSSSNFPETRRTYNLRPRKTTSTASYSTPDSFITLPINPRTVTSVDSTVTKTVSENIDFSKTFVNTMTPSSTEVLSSTSKVSNEDSTSKSTTESLIILITAAKSAFKSKETSGNSAIPESTTVPTGPILRVSPSTAHLDSLPITSLTTLRSSSTSRTSSSSLTSSTTISSPTTTLKVRTTPEASSQLAFRASKTTSPILLTTKSEKSSLTPQKFLPKSTVNSISKPSEDPASKSASTAANESQSTVTIISILVVILLCIIGGIIYFKRRQKLIKQSELSDDSEMRFLSDNEVMDFSDPSVLDKILEH